MFDRGSFLPGRGWCFIGTLSYRAGADFSIHFRLLSDPMVREKLVQPLSSIARRISEKPME